MKTYQEFISEAKKCWPGYKKKGTQKLFGKTYNRCVKEGKVPWDDPKYPLQSGWTPAEKNRAKRERTGVEDPNNPQYKISDKDMARYSGMKEVDDTETSKSPKQKKTLLGKKKPLEHKTPPHKFKKQRHVDNTSDNPYSKNSASGLLKPATHTKGQGRRAVGDKFDSTIAQTPIRSDDTRRRTSKKWGGPNPKKEEFEYELEESSSGERSGRRTRGKVTLARGRGADMDRKERTTAAIAKKAGLKGTGKYSTKDLRTRADDYTTYDSDDTDDDYGSTEQDHYIRTHSSARKAAKGEHLVKKYKFRRKTPEGHTKVKTAPSSESVRRVKDLRKQMTKAGANKRGPVHTVDIMHRDSDVGKGDKDQQMERGRNFIQALKDTPKHLKRAGAKKGETVVGKPTAVMSGEDQKTGVAKRAKLYKKVFGKKSTEKSAKTGLMTGKVD